MKKSLLPCASRAMREISLFPCARLLGNGDDVGLVAMTIIRVNLMLRDVM